MAAENGSSAGSGGGPGPARAVRAVRAVLTVVNDLFRIRKGHLATAADCILDSVPHADR